MFLHKALTQVPEYVPTYVHTLLAIRLADTILTLHPKLKLV